MQREITLVKKVRKRIQSEFYKKHNSSIKIKIIIKKNVMFCYSVVTRNNV